MQLLQYFKAKIFNKRISKKNHTNRFARSPSETDNQKLNLTSLI